MSAPVWILTLLGFVTALGVTVAVIIALVHRLIGARDSDEEPTGEWHVGCAKFDRDKQMCRIGYSDELLNAGDDLSVAFVGKVGGVPDTRWATRERGWMGTFSGRKFYPLQPRAEDVELADVAQGLAMTCRYGGQTKRYYSVAEHCYLVSCVVEDQARESGMPAKEVRELALAALLHDSAEAYIGDMVRPLKHQPEMVAFRKCEELIEVEIARAFNISAPDASRKIIKVVDDRILVDEIQALLTDPTLYLDVEPLCGVPPLGVTIEGWPPEYAKMKFLERYRELTQ